MGGLRVLTAAGAALVALGWVVGWYTRASADAAGPGAVVRPHELLVPTPLGWLAVVLALPLLLAPLVPFERRPLSLVSAACLPALVAVWALPALRPRTVVPDETIGEIVLARPLGQALALAGTTVVAMGLLAAARRAPDWQVPPRWMRSASARTATEG